MIQKFIDSLYDTVSDLPTEAAFYDQSIKDIESHSLSPQVFQILKNQEKIGRTPMFFQERLAANSREVLYQNIFIKSQTENILQRFEMTGIEIIPLKGIFFAERYFGHIGARPTSDIDILVRKEYVKLAIEIVKSMGFLSEEEVIPLHFHRSFSKEIPGSPIPLTVEIHWDILKESTSNFKIEEFWDEAIPLENYQNVKALTDYHSFYMMCLHVWRHNLDSPKHYLDIIQMIYMLRNQLDFEILFKDAEIHRTLKRITRTLSIIYNEFPMLNKFKEYPKVKRNRFQEKNQYMNFIDYQFLSYDTTKHSLIELSHWLLPSKYDIRSELKYACNKDVYLLNLMALYKQRGTDLIRAITV